MVIAHPSDGETVFAVFATHVRHRSSRSLVRQAVACTLAAALLAILLPPWWPASAVLGAGACYAAWGLIDRWPRSRVIGLGLRALAVLTTVLAIIAVIGIGLAAFTGDARSPYGTCYDVNGRAFACNAQGERR